jgi:hypothetical protein
MNIGKIPYNVNFIVNNTGIENTCIFTYRGNNELVVTRIRENRGGKSGDSVSTVQINNKIYILKIFTAGNETKNKNELDSHIKFMSMFTFDYMPCPKIYTYGKLSNIMPFTNNAITELSYILMEALVPAYELNDYISSVCNRTEPIYPLNLIDILYQLFYILSNMILKPLLHCDMHTKNIMIIFLREPSSINFKKVLGGLDDIHSYKSIVKIIDFGEASIYKCNKHRTTSGALNDLKRKCSGVLSPDRFSLIWGEISRGYNSNVDINFLCRIIEIMSMINIKIARINTKLIFKQSLKIYLIDMSNESNQLKKIKKKIILNIIYNEIKKCSYI